MADSDGICGVCHHIDEENLDRLQIQCDGCNAWYHANCVNLEEYEIDDIDHYHCDKCVPTLGLSKEKPVVNNHRHDYSEANADNKPMQAGTSEFVYHLRRRKFPSSSNVMVFMDNGYDLTSRFLELCSFDKPVLVKSSEGLGINVPSSTLSLDDIEQLIEPDLDVDVIDVQRQHSYKMKFSRFVHFFRQPKRKRIYNLISLEFSGTKMANVVDLPTIVDELSWVTQFWPKKFDGSIGGGNKELSVLNEHVNIKPEVSKFCLISMRDSYTDFHIDFGGTSVWYHVLWGEKWFYLVEPTDSNLALYDDWSHATNKTERFFGDEVDRCYSCVLKPGQTLFIPTGWIHAVLTPVDSLVFGGNFLHSFNISLQIRIYEMELAAATHEKFMFPHFELLNWYAGLHFLDVLKDANEENVPVKNHLLRGIRSLIVAMKRWIVRNQAKSPIGAKRNDKIDSMTCAQLLKKLEKALTVNEKFLVQSKNQSKSVKRQSKRPIDSGPIKNVPKLTVSTSVATGKTSATVKEPTMKSVVPGSFKNAAKKKIDKSESDLIGCPKSPVKISLKPGVWNVPVTAANKIALSPSSPVTPSGSLKFKLPRSDMSSVEESLPANESVEDKLSVDGSALQPSEISAEINVVPIDDLKSVSMSSADDSIHSAKIHSTETSIENPDLVNISTVQPVRKKVGFSLLDLNKMPSSPPVSSTPLSPRFNLPKAEANETGADSVTDSTTSSEKVQHVTKSEKSFGSNHQKLKLKISNKAKNARPKKMPKSDVTAETGTHLTGIFGVSKHGRVQKMNQKVFGEAGKTTEFVPELGHCRKDEEFVYPSLFDSDGEDGRSKKRSKQDDGSALFSPPGKFSLTAFQSAPPKKQRKKGVQKPEPYHSTTNTTVTSSEDSHVISTAQTSSLLSSNKLSTATTGAHSGLKKPTASNNKSAVLKPKKKVTTAKQRLATKLKLHKMIPTL